MCIMNSRFIWVFVFAFVMIVSRSNLLEAPPIDPSGMAAIAWELKFDPEGEAIIPGTGDKLPIAEAAEATSKALSLPTIRSLTAAGWMPMLHFIDVDEPENEPRLHGIITYRP